ncbi:MAG: GNAT family N-acetyltransferase [Clostridia bacterium]|nr:GNAT family N-acetyltransferase [Clostridia bacterium]
MKMQKLDGDRIPALVGLSSADGFPFVMTEETARVYCGGRQPADDGVQTYGVFEDAALVCVATATFCRVFPHAAAPSGRIVHISGVYTLPDFRNRRYAAQLLDLIGAEARAFGADYLCCDSTADGFYLRCGFAPAPESETKMWKTIHIL